MIRTIVNADDFGISSEVNDAIALCFQKRMITNTTLMVNMPYASDAVFMAKEAGFAERVGLHLNLTAGVPLTSPIRSCRLFCDKKGEFNAKFHLSTSTRLKVGKTESEALKEEIEAQIRRYLTFGLPEKHLDSHHHVHTDFSVWKVAEPLLRKYDFRSVRISRNMYEKTNVFNALYKKKYNKRVQKTGMETTDFFGSFRDFEKYAPQLPENALVEIMLHPMFSEDGILMDTKIPMEQTADFIESQNVLAQAY